MARVVQVYHHFDKFFSGLMTSPNNSGQSSGNNTHTTNASVDGMKAMMAAQPEFFVDDDCWFPDFGATNHVRDDLGSSSLVRVHRPW